MNGVLILNKPAGMTSHDVVHRVRKILQQRAVGHLGTLDPMATGVLPLVLGRMTRLAQFYTTSDKTYEGEIRFGFATDTYDADGEPTGPQQNVRVALDDVRRVAAKFVGIIQQTPPPFSAKKIQGVPAYKLARKKKDVELNPVQVQVRTLDILSVMNDRARFRTQVSSGTYIRSIAHEMGQCLGIGAHLSALTRTAVGEFCLDQCVTLEQIATSPGEVAGKYCFHPRRLLPQFPSVTTTEEVAGMIRNGRAVNLPEMSQSKLVKVFRGQSDLIAIASRVAGTLFQPKVVLSD
ncbi:MAG TPA: tRNA pseudouridine(55) synthase TruB [Terriglobales bacterium]|nr:tRNA pseudouridine(55) synthase TruB [Terriglobales bacterium]